MKNNKHEIHVTADHFGISHEDVRKLVGDTKFQYNTAELPTVKFFHEYLRKILDSRQ